MNAQKFTQKSLEAIQEANNLALSNNNMQIEQEHLLYALLTIDQSLIAQLIKKMGKDPQALTQAVKQEIDKMPGVTGSGREAGKIYVAQDVDTVLAKAENIADSMKDEYVSVEHIMLSLLENPNRNLKEIFKLFDIRKNDFLKVLQEVRGNTRVTSDSPEGTYDVLKKYGHDLVEDARETKAGPGHRQGLRDPQRHDDPVQKDQEQPGADRRAGRRQDRHRRGAGPAHRARRRSCQPEGQDHLLAWIWVR